MNLCESIRTDLDAYRDQLLAEERCQEIETHLNGCNECRGEMQRNEMMEQALQENALAQWVVPEGLWGRILNSYASRADSQDSSGLMGSVPRRWMMAAMMFLVIGLSGLLLYPDSKSLQPDPVAAALVNEFHTFVISRRELDFNHEQPGEIRQWFSNKVDFRVPMPVVSAELQLTGGRLCNMLDQRVASYMYQSDGAWISLYIMKQNGSDKNDSVGKEQLVQGYGYIDWIHNGLHYSLVGDIPVERLRQFANYLNRRLPVVVSHYQSVLQENGPFAIRHEKWS